MIKVGDTVKLRPYYQLKAKESQHVDYWGTGKVQYVFGIAIGIYKELCKREFIVENIEEERFFELSGTEYTFHKDIIYKPKGGHYEPR